MIARHTISHRRHCPFMLARRNGAEAAANFWLWRHAALRAERLTKGWAELFSLSKSRAARSDRIFEVKPCMAAVMRRNPFVSSSTIQR